MIIYNIYMEPTKTQIKLKTSKAHSRHHMQSKTAVVCKQRSTKGDTSAHEICYFVGEELLCTTHKGAIYNPRNNAHPSCHHCCEVLGNLDVCHISCMVDTSIRSKQAWTG